MIICLRGRGGLHPQNRPGGLRLDRNQTDSTVEGETIESDA